MDPATQDATTSTATEDETKVLTPEEQAQADAQADADMSAGFNEVRSGEPAAAAVVQEETTKTDDKAGAKAEETAAADTTAAAGTKAAATVDDEWEGVSPVVRKKLEQLESIPNQIRNLAGHIGGLKSAVEEAKTAAKTTAATGTAAPSTKEITDASGSGEKWKQLAADFPEWAEATEERFAAVLAAKQTPVDVEGITRTVTTAATAAAREAGIEARRLAQVDIAHEGWEETVNTAAFGTWLGAQPQEVKALAGSNNPRDAIKMLDAYKAHEQAAASTAAAAVKTKQRLAGATTVKSVSVGGPPVLSDDDAFVSGFQNVRGRAA